MFYISSVVFLCYFQTIIAGNVLEYCDKDVKDCKIKTRYLFYDVNPPEGFNLRRDVYMRYASLAKHLAKSKEPSLNNFKLVLPPWSALYHWKRSEEPEHIPWGRFFDVDSMKLFAPVIEMHEFFDEISSTYGKLKLDEVYVLQHYQDMFTTGKFEDKMSVEECNEPPSTNFFYYKNITSNSIKCLSFHGFATQLQNILKTSTAQTILFDHGEVALHDRFGDRSYWRCRRSMRFSRDLRQIAEKFRATFLNSSDVFDGTELPEDWRDEKPKRSAKGGPYLAIHMRRRDFVWGRPKQVPSLQRAAKQIKAQLKLLQLTTVFIATDAPLKEFEELKLLLGEAISVHKFKPNKEIKKQYSDGGIAIIEQIICSHARYFIGTHESTYSFRIQEEREIMGFPAVSSFNRLCGDEEVTCAKTSNWLIEY